jgi:hypothetical protein
MAIGVFVEELYRVVQRVSAGLGAQKRAGNA